MLVEAPLFFEEMKVKLPVSNRLKLTPYQRLKIDPFPVGL